MTGPRQPGNAPVYDDKQLMLIRASFLLGVLMFGGVSFFLHRQNGVPPGPVPDGLIYVPIAAIAIALLAIFPVRTLWTRAAGRQQRVTFAFIGWAMGEGAALAGGVYYFATDDAKFFVVGVFVLLATVMLFPITRQD